LLAKFGFIAFTRTFISFDFLFASFILRFEVQLEEPEAEEDPWPHCRHFTAFEEEYVLARHCMQSDDAPSGE